MNRKIRGPESRSADWFFSLIKDRENSNRRIELPPSFSPGPNRLIFVDKQHRSIDCPENANFEVSRFPRPPLGTPSDVASSRSQNRNFPAFAEKPDLMSLTPSEFRRTLRLETHTKLRCLTTTPEGIVVEQKQLDVEGFTQMRNSSATQDP
jgi:hypothetical protein